MKTIIIEDDPNAREVLIQLLSRNHPEIEVIGIADNFLKAKKQIQKHDPDLIFLDIELNNDSGFDLLKELKAYSFQTIFFTAYNQYAVEAFKYNALDYLLKPVGIKDLARSINRARKNVKEKYLIDYENLLSFLQENQAQKITLPVGRGLIYINAQDIIYLVADRSYCKVFTLSRQRPIIISKSLKKVHSRVSSREFVRVHHSYVINKNHISEFQRQDGGLFVMRDGKSIPISQKFKKDIKSAISNYF